MREILNLKIMIICAIMMSMIVPMAYSIDITLLHEFEARANPYGNLILDSGKLYGMTEYGGDADYGVIFSIDADGSNFAILHNFTGETNDGGNPRGNVIIDSGKLYGMAPMGGDADYGVIFSIETDGSNFAILHNFTGGGDGKWPYESLIVDSGKLYGMGGGGSSDDGVIFSIDADGNNFAILHNFTGETNNGGNPRGNVIIDSGKLYGMTYEGGSSGDGVIFSIDADGSNFAILHNFTNETNDGAYPEKSLILDSGKLYGIGGDADYGIIFSIDTDGGNFAILHNFTGETNDGAYPSGDLILDFGKLYGMTNIGGDADYGVIFSIRTDSTGFTQLYAFEGGGNDGAYPEGSLLLDSGKLYGTTEYGGDTDDGVIFSLHIGSSPLYSNFAPDSETTNFSAAADFTNVSNVTLATDQGIIKFPDRYNVNTDDEDYNSNVIIQTGFISVNSSALDSSFNASAKLTFYSVNCSAPTVYFSDTSNSKSDVLAEGNVCNAPRCTDIQCSDNTLTVNVTSFSAYAINGSSSLEIDADDPKNVGELVSFTANYSNETSGFIDGANCTIFFNDSSVEMDEQADIYNYSRTFSSVQTVNYNVTCSKIGYNPVTVSDTAQIEMGAAVPEFSTITLGLGLVIVLAGLIIVRRKTNTN